MASMEPVLIAIGALGLLGLSGVVLLARRLSRVEHTLKRLDDLDELARQVHGFAVEFDRKELNSQLQAKMTEVAENHRRLTHALQEVRDGLAELRELAPSTELLERAEAAAAVAPPDVSELVRRHLLGVGFEDIHILTDLTSLSRGLGAQAGGRGARIVFEARRGGVMHKGHVHLKDGAVAGENVRAAYSAFP